jgi:hypothetical protein
MSQTFVISPIDTNGRMAVLSFPNREAAQAAASKNDYVIGGAADVIFTGQMLVDVFNAVTDSGVKKFESRCTGVKRLLSVLPQVAKEPQMSETKTKEKKAGRPPVGEGHASKKDWKKPRDGTMRADILKAMIGKSGTVAQIAKAAGVPEDRVLPHIYATWRDCGIGYKVSGEGDKVTYEADLPAGADKTNLFAAPPEKKAKAPKAAKAAAA